MKLTIATSTTRDPRERGRDLGTRFGDRYRRIADLYLRHFEDLSISADTVRRIADSSHCALAEWAPGLALESESIAAAAGLESWKLAAVGARTEILAAAPPRQEGECSTAVFTGIGRDAETIQTWDWHDYLVPAGLLLNFVSNAGRKVKMFTEFGTAAKIGVNDAGIGVHFNILSHESDSASGGVPVHATVRRILDEATTVEEAGEIAHSAGSSASTSVTVVEGHGDDSRAVSFELSPVGVATVPPSDDGWLLHTNHFLDPDLSRGDTMPASSTTSPRYDHLDSLRGELTGLSCRGRAHAACGGMGEAAAICVLADNDIAVVDQWRTLLTICIDVAGFSLDYCPGNPAEAAARGLTRL